MIIKKTLPTLALTALFITGCAANKELVVSEVRSSYDRGFEIIAVALSQQSQNSIYAELEKLKNFRQEMIRWGELRGEVFYARESGPRKGALLVVVPQGHHVINEMISTLQTYATPKFRALLIKPEKITDQWAGIFLVHELSHLMDYCNGIEPDNATRKQFLEGEIRAHRLEFMAANLLSKGAIQKQIDALLIQWQLKSYDELFDKFKDSDFYKWYVLEEAMDSKAPASYNEAGLRNGFYITSTMLRYTDVHKLNEKELLKAFETIMSMHNLNKIRE